jgi:hypothetical protein
VAIANQERVGKAMELLREGLAPFVEREMLRPGLNFEQREHKMERLAQEARLTNQPLAEWGVAGPRRGGLGAMFDMGCSDNFEGNLSYSQRQHASAVMAREGAGALAR